MLARTLALTATVAIPLGMVSPAEAAPAMQITKVQYNSPGTDTKDNSSLNGEWVRIKNTASTARTITGWTLRDTANHVYTFPKTTVEPGASIYVYTGTGSNTSTKRYWGMGWHVWNNSGDEKVRLRNANGTAIDSCDYTGSSAGYTTC